MGNAHFLGRKINRILFALFSVSALSGCTGSSGQAIDKAIGLLKGDEPVLTAVASRTIQQTETLLIDLNNVKDSNPGDDKDMTYLCTWDQVVDGKVETTSTCDTLPGGAASFDGKDGILNWTPTIAELGDFEIQVKGTNKGGSSVRLFSVGVRLHFLGIESMTNIQGDRMDLGWTANAAAFGYQIMRKNVDGSFSIFKTLTGGSVSNFTLTGLTPLESYTFRIYALDALGNPDGNSASLTGVTTDLIRLEITAVDSELSPGQSTLVTCKMRDGAGNYITTSGLGVSFMVDGPGSGTGTFSPTTDVGGGVYTAVFTATTPGTLTNLSAAIPQYHYVQARSAMTVRPLRIEILASGTTLNPAGVVSLTAKIRDFNGNLISSGGHGLTFSAASGTGSGTFGAVTDNGNGTYTGSFTATTAGTVAFTASISTTSVIHATTSVTIQPWIVEITSALADLSVTRSTIITGRIKDWQGNYLIAGGKGMTLSISSTAGIGTLSSTTDIGDGTYKATLLGVSLGSVTITGSLAQSYTVSAPANVAIKKLRLEFATSSANLMPGQTSTLTGIVKDWQGTVVGVGGHGLSISTTGGTSSGTLSTVTDNGNGTYSAVFTAGGAGTALSITGSINDPYQVDVSPTVQVQKWLVDISASANTVAAGQTITLTATVKNHTGVQASTGGQSVFFSFTGGTSSGSLSSVTDHNNGTYTAVFTAVTPGTAITASASLAQSYQVNSTVSVTVQAVKLLVAVNQSSLNPGKSVTVTAQVQDQSGVNLISGSYAIGFSFSGGTSTGSFSATTALGNGLFMATFTGASAGTAVTLSANANVSFNVATPQPTITVVPWKIELAAAATSVTVGQSTIITGRIKDWQNSYITNGGDNLTMALVTAGRGSLSSVTDNLDGTYSANFTASGVGTTAVTGSLSNSCIVTVSPTITVTPVHIALSAVQNSMNPGDSVTILAQVKDDLGNNLLTGSYAIGLSYSGGTSTGILSSTLNLGLGLYSVQFSGAVAGTTIAVTGNANVTYVVDNTISLTVVPWKIEISASSTDYVINETGTLTGRIKDWQNNYLSAGGKALNLSLVTAGIGTIGATTDNADGTYSASFQANAMGSTAVSGNISQSYQVTVAPTLTVEKVYLSVTLGSPEASTYNLNSGSTVVVTARLKDSGGNLVTGTGYVVSFSVSSGSSTVSQSVAVETTAGVYQANFQGILAGTALTVSAATTIPYSLVSSGSLTVIPGTTISAANSTLVSSAASVRSGNSVTLTATLKDAAGNTIPGLAGVSFANAGGTSTGTFGAVSGVGGGVYTSSFQGVDAGTATTISVTHAGVTASQVASVAVTSGNPTKLTVTGPSSVKAQDCSSAFSLNFFDSSNNATSLASATTFAFGGKGYAHLYSDSGCTVEISDLAVSSGQLISQNFYLKSYDPTTLSLTFTSAGITQNPSTHSITVVGETNWIGLAGLADTITSLTASNNYYAPGKYDASFQNPWGMTKATILGIDYLFIADSAAHVIMKVRVSDGAIVGKIGRISSVIGSAPTSGGSSCTSLGLGSGNVTGWCPNGIYQSGGIDGAFNGPAGIVYLGGYLYVSDQNNHRIVKIDAETGEWIGWSGRISTSPAGGNCSGQTGTTSTWCLGGAGTTTTSSSVASPTAYVASGSTTSGATGGNEFRNPTHISTDGNYLYVADVSNNRLVKLDPNSGLLLGWMGWVKDNSGISCSSGTTPGNAVANTATEFTDSWCTGGQSTSLNAAQVIGSAGNWIKIGIGWQQNRGVAFYNDGTNDFMYVADSGVGRIMRYTRTGGLYRGWTGRTYNNVGASSVPAAPAPIASLMTGTCSATAQSYTMGWCYGGGAQNANNTNGLSVPFGIRVNSGVMIIANSASANISKMNLSTGVFSGYIGRVSATPTGGFSGCSTTASGSSTPGWCVGGTTTHGYGVGTFSRLDSAGNAADGVLDIETDDTKLYSLDRMNYRIVVNELSTGSPLGGLGLRINSLPSTWNKTYSGLPATGFTPTSVVLNRDALFNAPYGVSVSGTSMFVADTSNHRIKKYTWDTGTFDGWIGVMSVFSPNGGDESCIGATVGGMTPNWCKGGGSTSTAGTGFSGPRDMVTDGTNIYVTDTGNHRLAKARLSDGLFLGWMGGVASGGTPTDSLYDVAGCTAATNPNATPNFCLGGSSGASALANGFSSPRAIDGFTDSADAYNPHHYYLIVADSGNNRIQKIDATLGTSVGWVGRISSGTCGTAGVATSGWCMSGAVNNADTTSTINNARMTTPAGVWVDTSATPIVVYVADNGFGKVLKFNASTGQFLGWTGRFGGTTTNHGCASAPTANTASGGWCTGGNVSNGTGDGEYTAPHGITGDASYIYVTDTTTHRINRINKSTGQFAGWKGRIQTVPSSPAACSSSAVGDITPDWCMGGTAQPGYAFDPNSPSKAAGLDTPRGITARGNYLIVVDSGNGRVVQIPK